MKRNNCLRLGIFMVVGLVGVTALAPMEWLFGQTGPRAADRAPANDLTVVHGTATNGTQQIIVIDGTSRVMGSYAIDPQTGSIALRSVRNIAYDLILEEFNAAPPAPGDVKALLEKR